MTYDIYMTHRRKDSRDSWAVAHWQQDAQNFSALRGTILLLVDALDLEYGRLDVSWDRGRHDEVPGVKNVTKRIFRRDI